MFGEAGGQRHPNYVGRCCPLQHPHCPLHACVQTTLWQVKWAKRREGEANLTMSGGELVPGAPTHAAAVTANEEQSTLGGISPAMLVDLAPRQGQPGHLGRRGFDRVPCGLFTSEWRTTHYVGKRCSRAAVWRSPRCLLLQVCTVGLQWGLPGKSCLLALCCRTGW